MEAVEIQSQYEVDSADQPQHLSSVVAAPSVDLNEDDLNWVWSQQQRTNPLDVIPLSCLQAGESGRIAWIDGAADFTTRLAEMGLCEGTLIRMVQPGSPCILAVNGQRLSLRFEGDTQVFLEAIHSEVLTA